MRAEFDPFYALAKQLGVVLLFHDRYPNLYGDTAILASLIRWRSLKPFEPNPGLPARKDHPRQRLPVSPCQSSILAVDGQPQRSQNYHADQTGNTTE
jgi:hypothetical protein